MIYNKIYDIYINNNNNKYKLNTLNILLNLIDNKNNYDNEFIIIYNKYLINYKTKNIYSFYYGLYIFDHIESFLSFLQYSTDIELFNELSNYLLNIKK